MHFSRSRTGLRPASCLFIDEPNIYRGGQKVSPGSDVDWKRIGNHMLREAKDFSGTDMLFAAAYARVDRSAEDVQAWIERTFTKFGKHMTYVDPVEFSVIARSDKDIDALIVNDVWRSIVSFDKAMLSSEKDIYPLQMRHVLLSGDGDYLDAYESILDTYGQRLELELIVYSWKAQLNPVLRRFAAEVRYLDDLPDILVRRKHLQGAAP